MPLEDHVGDVIHKARSAAGVSVSVAAAAAGLTESELSAMERSGTTAKQPNWLVLAQVLGINASKLKTIAYGWYPAVPDLSRWRELRQIKTVDADMEVNCYLVWEEVSHEAALFDTGFDAEPVFELIQVNGLVLRDVFLTHLHHDHVGALNAIRNKYPLVHIHSNSTTFLPQHRNLANDFVHLGSMLISHLDTPGHSEEGATYIVGNWPDDAPHVAFVGDALFAGSIGRGNQSWVLAKQKVSEQILTLPPDTLIGPGHGPWTTVAEERANNPFF